jgi:hypothetical protein
MQRIGILLFDDVEELDAVGPWEVFGAWAQAHPDEAEVVAFATGPGPVRGAKGLKFQVDHGLDEVGRLDVLLHPGGRGTRVLLKDPDHLAWMRARRIRRSTAVQGRAIAGAGPSICSMGPSTTSCCGSTRFARMCPICCPMTPAAPGWDLHSRSPGD